MSGEAPLRFTATAEDRLDRAVTAGLGAYSRSQVQHLIEQGRVTVGGNVASRAALGVSPGDVVTVTLPNTDELDLEGAAIPLEVIYEDETTLILNKQSQLLVHPVAGRPSVSLVQAVRACYPEVREMDAARSGVVHRLDRDTTGVLAFAKSDVARETLRDQWREREPLKLYLALVEGRVDPARGHIDAPLGADPRLPQRRAVVEDGERAETYYEVLREFGTEASLLEVRIITGRTHQIRVHMEAIGHPVIADTLYGSRSELIGRQALHAWRLGLRLPSSGEWREFEAPLPQDMAAAITALEARHPAETAAAGRQVQALLGDAAG